MATGEEKGGSFADHIALGAYKLICIVLKMLDVRVVAVAGRAIGYLVWLAMPKRRSIVARNSTPLSSTHTL